MLPLKEPGVLNSYAFDFWTHSTVHKASTFYLVQNNGFSDVNAYYQLKDFSSSLRLIATAITMQKEKDEAVALCFGDLSEEYNAMFGKIGYSL